MAFIGNKRNKTWENLPDDWNTEESSYSSTDSWNLNDSSVSEMPYSEGSSLDTSNSNVSSDSWNNSVDEFDPAIGGYDENGYYVPPSKKAQRQRAKREKAENKKKRKEEKVRLKQEQKEAKQRQKDFIKEQNQDRVYSSEESYNIYQRERKGNRKDLLILGCSLILIIGVVAGIVFLVLNISNQKIYTKIKNGNYATAYSEIKKQYDKGKNVDGVVCEFANVCIDNAEYKRAIQALYMLSDNGADEEFFDDMISRLIQHNKINRVIDVFEYLYSRGTAHYNEIGNNLYEKYVGD